MSLTEQVSYAVQQPHLKSDVEWAKGELPNADNSPDAPKNFNSLLNLLPGIIDTGNLIAVLTAIFDQLAYINTIDEINKPPSHYFRAFGRESRESLETNEKLLERLLDEAALIERAGNSAAWQKGSSNISAKLAEMLEKLRNAPS